MKKLLAALLIAAPAYAQPIVVKDKGSLFLVVPDCNIKEDLVRAKLKRLSVGAKIILYTKEKRHSCSIERIEPYFPPPEK
jgi:hypothetical protein